LRAQSSKRGVTQDFALLGERHYVTSLVYKLSDNSHGKSMTLRVLIITNKEVNTCTTFG
jgi:hypothetical protein